MIIASKEEFLQITLVLKVMYAVCQLFNKFHIIIITLLVRGKKIDGKQAKRDTREIKATSQEFLTSKFANFFLIVV